MSNPIEVSLNNLSQAAVKVLDKIIANDAITDADKLVLTMYQNEKRRAMYVPTYKKVINSIKELVLTVKELLPKETETSEVEKNTETSPQETDFVEVNTDEL